jgi:hypothetical protein
VMKGATWPLAYIVGPMLAKSFSIIRSSVSWYYYKLFFDKILLQTCLLVCL